MTVILLHSGIVPTMLMENQKKRKAMHRIEHLVESLTLLYIVLNIRVHAHSLYYSSVPKSDQSEHVLWSTQVGCRDVV